MQRTYPTREPVAVALGIAVRHLRGERGWSQEALAYRAGLHPKYVGTIERGERSPTLTTIFKLAGGLEVAPGTLLDAADELMR